MAKKPTTKKKAAPAKKAKAPKADAPNKHGLNIEDIITEIVDGQNFRQMANKFNVPLSTLHDFINRAEHSARTRAALELSAAQYADKGEDVLLKCEGTKEEISRARELAQHYRWMAGKRNPKKYGDKIDMTTDGKAIGFKIGYKKDDEQSTD